MNETPASRSPALSAILDGAFDQFVRHGFAKSTMTDIANAAGVSRRALYNHFPAKEDVFKAVCERIGENVYDAVVAANKVHKEPDARLMAVIHARVGWIYELLHASEFAREFIDEKNRIAGEHARAASKQFELLTAKIIKEMGLGAGEAKEAADVLVHSVYGVLENAESRSSAEANVTLLVRVFATGLSTSGGLP